MTNFGCENKEHLRALERILKTLVGTQSLGLNNVMHPCHCRAILKCLIEVYCREGRKGGLSLSLVLKYRSWHGWKLLIAKGNEVDLMMCVRCEYYGPTLVF